MSGREDEGDTEEDEEQGWDKIKRRELRRLDRNKRSAE